MSDFYGENPIINDKSDVSDIILDSSQTTFIGKTDIIGKVIMTLIRYKSPKTAKEINQGLKLAVTEFDITSKEPATLPENYWIGKTLVDDIYASATYHDVVIWLIIEGMQGIKPEETAGFALMLIQNQIIHLEDAGY